MTKLITLPILYGFYQSPVIILLTLIALVFLADLYSRYTKSRKIVCIIPDFSTWDYRSLQSYAKSHGIKANSKRTILISSLLQKIDA